MGALEKVPGVQNWVDRLRQGHRVRDQLDAAHRRHP